MSALIPGCRGAVSAVAAKASPQLERALRDLANPHPDVGPIRSLPAHIRAEAKMAADAMDDVLRAASEGEIVAWLKPISAAVRVPLSRDDFRIRAAAICVALQGIPHSVLTPATQREAMQKFDYFPAASDVHTLLTEHASPLRARARLLRQAVAADGAVPDAPSMTDQARMDLAAKLRGLSAELGRGDDAEARPPVRPSYLSGEHLRRARAAAGIVTPPSGERE